MSTLALQSVNVNQSYIKESDHVLTSLDEFFTNGFPLSPF
jgi:hypothetical protein